MTITNWGLILFLLVQTVAIAFIWVRLSRPVKDDPRMSRGLQLLQSKIAVLQDLLDRSEVQVKQLVEILEKKSRDVQNNIQQAERTINQVELASKKSLEVAKIFQDRIPHEEILSRQSTIKYVNAARMAHSGSSVDEIVDKVGISRAEAEFIAKVNRDQLMFNEEALPDWVQGQVTESVVSHPDDFNHHVLVDHQTKNKREPKTETIFVATEKQEDLKKLGDQFRRVVQNAHEIDRLNHNSTQVPQSFVEIVPEVTLNTKGKAVEIKKVNFPRI